LSVRIVTVVSVVDASAIAAAMFGEAEGDAIQAQLPFKLASICAKRLKHHPGQARAILAQWRVLRQVPVELRSVGFNVEVRLAAAAR
jgi:hypothetical protein